ncbi:beta-phosphoglucomutase [Gilvibacter sp.]|uniref:beta-phosphoglucomutase n=1 Tax=Gilvibacter sp. TaxID=2729997 RepID=UPI003F49C847
MKIEGIIFDLDGVIVDTAHFHYLAWKKTAAVLGFELTPELNEQLKGVSRIDSLQKILDWAGVEITQERFDFLTSDKNVDYLAHVATMSADDVLPGVREFIADLKSKGYKIALGSASKNARHILERVGMIQEFEAIVDGTNVTAAKPDPEVFLQGAELLKLEPEQCVVFEDSKAGVTAANTGGMVSVGIGKPEHLSHAKHVFQDFTQIPNNFIDQLTSETIQ